MFYTCFAAVVISKTAMLDLFDFTEDSLSSSSVTFVTEDSFLKLPGWVYGDLEFSFRTHQSSALLLYQSSSNGDWFKVTLEAGQPMKNYSVKFLYSNDDCL